VTGRVKPHYTDVLLPTAVRVWYRLHADGCKDLHPVLCAHDVIGTAPEWWEEDLELAVSPGRWSYHTEVGGFAVHQNWIRWALRNGIAPGQAFLVHIPEPVCTGEGDDYDEDWSYELLEIAPASRSAARRRWEGFLRKQQMYRALATQSYHRAKKLIHKDTGSMYVRHTNYSSSSEYYGVPRGVQLRLCSTRREHIEHLGVQVDDGWCLASGRDDGGDRSRAMALLIEEACSRYPALSPRIIREMRVKH
jgi:hypothetical protein